MSENKWVGLKFIEGLIEGIMYRLKILQPETGTPEGAVLTNVGGEAEWKTNELPVATADTLGGVKVGEGLRMDGDVLGVEPDGEYELIETITIDTDTTIVSRTQTPSGEDYCYKDVIVNITYISEHERSMWARIKIWFDNNATLDAFRDNSAGTTIGEQVMQTNRYRNYVALRISGITTNRGNIVPENSVMISNAFVYNSGNIKRIDIDRQDGFFSGDVLRIYAVKG